MYDFPNILISEPKGFVEFLLDCASERTCHADKAREVLGRLSQHERLTALEDSLLVKTLIVNLAFGQLCSDTALDRKHQELLKDNLQKIADLAGLNPKHFAPICASSDEICAALRL